MTPFTSTPPQKLSAAALRHLKTAEELVFRAGLGESAPQFLSDLNAQLLRSPDDAMAMTNFLRFIESSFNPTAILRDLARHAVLRETLFAVFETSYYFSDVLIRDPELFRWLTATIVLEQAKKKEEFIVSAQQSIAPFQSLARKVNALKRYQRRETLRIGVRDILGLADLESTTRELSALADAIIALAGEIVWDELARQYSAVPGTAWAIFGLGKLGGNELNYSSDVDIIAVFDREGEIQLPGSGTMTYGEFFVRFVERLVHILSHPTEEGHFFRVDLRLRPDGKSGALIRSFASTLTYYESRGELWERQMLVKARCIAGDAFFAQKFLDALSPFVYPRTFFQNPIAEISRIRARIALQSDDHNIKLRPGGIRDIEFIVQALQLVNGGRNFSIRHTNTLAALEMLRTASLVSDDEARQLREAYVFFRIVEHRLQMLEYAQTHSLPEKEEDQAKLAARMGIRRNTFASVIKHHLANVRGIFDSVFAQKEPSHQSEVERFLHAKPDSEFATSFARRYRLSDPGRAARGLRAMMFGPSLSGKKKYTTRTQTHFSAIAEAFLEEIAVSVDPQRALMNAEKILSLLSSPESLYTLLSEKNFRRAFVTICARSSMLTKQFTLSPELGEVILTGIGGILEEHSISLPPRSGLHGWKSHEECKAAVRYVLGDIDERHLFSSLSTIGSQILSRVYARERKKIKLSHGVRFSILALGKLGGEEITFGSDLDIIVLYSAGRKSDAELCEKLAANIITACSRVTPAGKLYDVDARLRPEGRNAPLAVAGKHYLEYLHHRASLWERQSLTRVRPIAGDDDFSEEMIQSIRAVIYGTSLPKGWTAEILDMRRKTERRSRTSSADFFDIKCGPGGMMDVEFAVQALQLSRGKGAVASTNVYELLEKYGGDPDRGKKVALLAKSYRLIRRVETAMRVGLDLHTHIIPADEESVDYLGRLAGYPTGKEFLTALRRTMKEARSTFESLLRDIS